MAEQPKTWTVVFDSDAVVDFEDMKSRGDRKAVFNVVRLKCFRATAAATDGAARPAAFAFEPKRGRELLSNGLGES